MDENNIYITQRIKIARMISKLSHKQLAEKLNCKEELIHKYENGDVVIPFTHIITIHEKLNIPLEFIVPKSYLEE